MHQIKHNPINTLLKPLYVGSCALRTALYDSFLYLINYAQNPGKLALCFPCVFS